MKVFDVVIIGAGLAGLQCAKLLSAAGVKVLLADRKEDLKKGIHTTGIFPPRVSESSASLRSMMFPAIFRLNSRNAERGSNLSA